jgi:hypothetical protein
LREAPGEPCLENGIVRSIEHVSQQQKCNAGAKMLGYLFA